MVLGSIMRNFFYLTNKRLYTKKPMSCIMLYVKRKRERECADAYSYNTKRKYVKNKMGRDEEERCGKHTRLEEKKVQGRIIMI